MKPVTPSSTISGTEPRLNAITGVPHAIASIITRPNGSGQSIGISRAVAPDRKPGFCLSLISPIISTPGTSSSWRMFCSKYTLSATSTLAASLIGMPAAWAMRMARSGHFSGAMRPRKAR